MSFFQNVKFKKNRAGDNSGLYPPFGMDGRNCTCGTTVSVEEGRGRISVKKADNERVMKSLSVCILLASAFFSFAQEQEITIPPPPRPAPVENPGPLPRSFRQLSLGMSLDELKEALAGDGLFVFRGDRDVSFLPVKEENLVETTGLSFIRRAFFQLRDGKVFIMAFSLDPDMVDHYSVFTTLREKYGDPESLSPGQAVWENGETRVSLERPLTVKYIDMEVFNRIIDESKAEGSSRVFLRERFLDEF
jgi:hypothetical protein